MNKFICHCIHRISEKPLRVVRIMGEAGVANVGSENISKNGRDTLGNRALDVKRNIEKRATSFKEMLDSMTEEQLVAKNPTDLGEEAKKSIDALIAASPIELQDKDSISALEEAKKIVTGTRTQQFGRIDGLVKNYESIKSNLNTAMAQIQEGMDYFDLGNRLMDQGSRIIPIIFNVDQKKPADMNEIMSARAAVKKMQNDITLNHDAFHAMAKIGDALSIAPYEGFQLARKGAQKIIENATSLGESTNTFSKHVEVADEYVRALEDKAKANGTGDGKLFDKAKKAKEQAMSKRDRLPPIDLQPEYTPPHEAKYKRFQVKEEELSMKGKPLPTVRYKESERLENLRNGWSTVIYLDGKPVDISKNEDGEYVLPSGNTRTKDVHEALFKARIEAWKAKYPGEKADSDSNTPVG